MARLLFHGAAREVTGSMHVLEVDGRRFALDCGLFQGRRAESEAKNKQFPLDPTALHGVVLSHAHMDHSGRLPLLVKQGFPGPIYATSATRDLCAVMLADSAHIQQEDAEYLNKKRARHGEPPIEPLYDLAAAQETIRRFHAVAHGRWFGLSRCVQCRFFETGHMLGSAGIELAITEPGRPTVRLVFSGDLGRFNMPIIRDPAPLPAADYLICESTYGGRTSPPVTDLPEQLRDVVRATIERGGKVVVPAFSVGRTQTVVYYLHRLMNEGQLPRIPVFIDSPLSVNATEVFRLHPECYDADAREFAHEVGDILGNGCCTYVRSVDQSKALHRRRAPCVIISASGMCETGRILHHLKNNIRNQRNTILIVGYQAAHTLGRRLVEGETQVPIFQQKYPVRAQVAVLSGFSAHADHDELMRLCRPVAAGCRRAFLVHGEPDQMSAFTDSLRGVGFNAVESPASGQSFELNGSA